LKQVGLYIEAQSKKEEEKTRTAIILADGTNRQLVSGISTLFDKKNKYQTVAEIYPALFGKRRNLTAAEKTKTETVTWLNFLYGGGGVNGE
jgi:hypothetical protein